MLRRPLLEIPRHKYIMKKKALGQTQHWPRCKAAMSRNDTFADYTDIRPIYTKSNVEVQLTAESYIFAIGQQHIVSNLKSLLKAGLTKDQWAQHEEAAVSYADLIASIEGYYEENVDHREQTDKLVQAIMDFLDKTATDMTNLLKALTEVTETLKVIQDAVKDDPTLNKKVIEATEAYTKNSTTLTEL
ncbi:hypothetical protein Tco_0694493, partial [Tanacetum coccineum]